MSQDRRCTIRHPCARGGGKSERGGRMNFRQALLRAVLAAAAVSLILAGPSFGVREAAPSKNGNLRDLVRSGALHKTTAAQRAAVRALHARATWNTYGTPSTLMRPR